MSKKRRASDSAAYLLVLSLAVLLMLPACGSDDPSSPDSGDNYADLTEVLNSAAYEPPTVADRTVVDPEEPDPVRQGWVCTTTHVDLETGADAYLNFIASNIDKVFPGALMQGNSLGTGATPTRILVDRAPGGVTISLANGSTQTSAQMPGEVSYGSYQAAVNEIIAANSGQLAANFTLKYSSFSSKEELALKLGVNQSAFGSSFEASLSLNSSTSKNRLLVELTQNFYTVVFHNLDTTDLKPDRPEQFFAASVTAKELEQFVYAGNPAVYINAVSYGRRFYQLIESNESRQSMEASAKASWTTGDFTSEAKWMKELDGYSSTTYAIGGEAGATLEAALGGGFDDLKGWLSQAATVETGVPLSYSFRTVKDIQDAGVQLATQYDVTNCTSNSSKMRITLNKYYCEMANDEGTDNTVDMDRFWVRATAYNQVAVGSDIVSSPPIINQEFLHNWTTGGERNFDPGDEWVLTGSEFVDISFDTENYDFELAKIVMEAGARDYDGTFGCPFDCPDHEWGYVVPPFEVLGDRFFENGGDHSFLIESRDFRFRVEVTIERIPE